MTRQQMRSILYKSLWCAVCKAVTLHKVAVVKLKVMNLCEKCGGQEK